MGRGVSARSAGPWGAGSWHGAPGCGARGLCAGPPGHGARGLRTEARAAATACEQVLVNRAGGWHLGSEAPSIGICSAQRRLRRPPGSTNRFALPPSHCVFPGQWGRRPGNPIVGFPRVGDFNYRSMAVQISLRLIGGKVARQRPGRGQDEAARPVQWTRGGGLAGARGQLLRAGADPREPPPGGRTAPPSRRAVGPRPLSRWFV